MRDIDFRTVCILGRQPALGLAELERLYGAEHVGSADGAALLDIEAAEIDFRRLGGCIKVARVLTVLPGTDWPGLRQYLIENIPKHMKYIPDGKFTLGISIYGLDFQLQEVTRGMLEIKKLIKAQGRPVRIVPNKTLELNSAQVLHNKLTSRGGWELLLVKYGDRTILAQTMFVQDIEAYGARDQARPKRDARVGMLPPKLAQIIVNMAVAGADQKVSSPTRLRILDPFCGTGVILQESLLMGFSVVGTDIDPRMTDYCRQNMQWLFEQYRTLEGHVTIETADATTYSWARFNVVASEVFLGRPLKSVPEPEKFKTIVNDANTIIMKFLKNLAPQLAKGQPICLAVPAWRLTNNQFKSLPLIDHLTDMGYTRIDLKHVSWSDLIYWRPGQVVGRQLLLLEKR